MHRSVEDAGRAPFLHDLDAQQLADERAVDRVEQVSPAGSQSTRRLADHLVQVRDVFEDVAAIGEVKFPVLHGEVLPKADAIVDLQSTVRSVAAGGLE